MSMYDARRPQSILVGTLAAKDLSATGVFAYNEVLMEDCAVSRLLVKVTVSIVSTSAVVITFHARPTYGSASSQVNLGTVTIPGGVAANAFYYADINPVDVPVGYQIVADVTSAASASGSALAGFLAQYSPEVPGNTVLVNGAS